MGRGYLTACSIREIFLAIKVKEETKGTFSDITQKMKAFTYWKITEKFERQVQNGM